MPHGIKLQVCGEFACFTRPEMKVERVSYDVITPSAARGVLEAIYWKPQFRWCIEKIHILKPIRFTSIRRNEVSAKASLATARKAMNGTSMDIGIDIESTRQQRASLILRDVSYGLEATIKIIDHRFDPRGSKLSENDCVGKHLAQFERRAKSGAHFHHPYFGNREFPAQCTWIDQDQAFPCTAIDPADLPKDLGWMLYDLDYEESNEKKGTFIESHQGRRIKAEPRFYRVCIDEDGVIDVRGCLANSSPQREA